MGIVLARIDNRLLHGIVATQWAGRSGAQRIMIIDDTVANNELTKASMKLARPTGMAISIITEETALNNFKAGKYNDHTVFVLVKKPETLVKLSEIGVKIPELVIGGTVKPAEGEEAVKLSQRAYAKPDDIEAYKKLKAAGTKLYAQYVPADAEVSIDEFLEITKGEIVMQLSALQIVLLVLVAAEINVDRRGLSLTHARPVIVGFLCGLILGDMNSGLYIGGTFTLMSLGVAALGGSSVPDYGVATIIACAFAKTTGQGPEVGMTIGLPVGMLGVQMDVLFKICNSFIAQKSQKYANEKQFGKMYAILYLCPVMVAVFMAFPTAVALTAGAPLVQAILDVLPSWVTGGLSVAGKLLPGLGIAMLLHYMPAKKYFNYILIGFVLSAYMGVPILGIAFLWCSFSLQVLYG